MVPGFSSERRKVQELQEGEQGVTDSLCKVSGTNFNSKLNSCQSACFQILIY